MVIVDRTNVAERLDQVDLNLCAHVIKFCKVHCLILMSYF